MSMHLASEKADHNEQIVYSALCISIEVQLKDNLFSILAFWHNQFLCVLFNFYNKSRNSCDNS